MKSLLVANRGEIACRIFRTARRLGVRTIAVYSDADAQSEHVRQADDAIRIGPAPSRESYLDVSRIMAAAHATAAEAVHPGYGFLSENASFAQACEEAGLAFVGPPAAAIRAMGSKIVAKARMRSIGIPVLPGYEGERQDLAFLHEQALALGLPLIIKPAAGGGGKGMRIIEAASELDQALPAARRLAESGFADGSLLLERYLPAPRHVEVQVFADRHGHFVHLGDRDCSIQRRHQKVIEEAPAPALPDELRSQLRAAAVAVAREIGYVSAGTVEFLFDGRQFYFMEMNTRLQVEHTVTEAVTGLDLVEWQIRIADGEPLPLAQDEIEIRGHAIEARVCAEDPARDFLPSAGKLRWMHWPRGESVRVDAGFETGDEVPDTYDSLLGKIVVWGESREEAATRLSAALRATYCIGLQTNERWLARILTDSRFLRVAHSIAFLQQHGAQLQELASPDLHALALAALALQSGARTPASEPISPWAALDGFIPNLPAQVDLQLSHGEQIYTASVQFEAGEPAAVTITANGASTSIRVGAVRVFDGQVSAVLDDRRRHGRFAIVDETLHLWVPEAHLVLGIADPRDAEFTAQVSTGGLKTPLPGVVVAVACQPGQVVKAGELLMVIEAMKMEHAICAPFDGTVKSVRFRQGDRVPEGTELMEIVP